MEATGRSAIVFGEVLFDRFPDREVLGGAPLNVAAHLSALGMPVHFISAIGQDQPAERVLQALRDRRIPTDDIYRDPAHPTGAVTIEFGDDGHHRFEILDQQAYDFISKEHALAQLQGRSPGVLCHGTLALRNPVSREALFALREAIDCPIFVDVNLRDPYWSEEIVRQSIRGAAVVKMNDEELARLSGCELPVTQDGLIELAVRFQEGHRIPELLLTRGASGAIALAQGRDPLVRPAPPVDRFQDSVGAGDAFSAGWLAASMAGRSPEIALERALELASRVCGIRGATPEDRTIYRGLSVSGRTP